MTIFIQKNDQALSNLQKQLFETAHVMLHIFNSKGQILDANSIWLNKMGHVRDDIIGKGLVEFIDPEYNAWFSKQFDKLKLTGSLAELPVKLVKEDGTFLDILFSAKKIDLEDNHSCYLGTCTDISTENKVLDNMYKMNLALEKSNDELENFVHIVSHDLKEPIRGISFKSSVIQEDFEDELPEEAKQDLKHIGDLCKYLAALITDLGNYAQIGFLDEEKTKIDLNLLIEELNDHRVPHDSDGFVQIEVVDPLPTLNI